MVVVQHVATRFDAELNPNGWGVWTDFANLLVPLRMPLFFFLSGFVVSYALKRGLVSLRRRMFGPLYLYILWTTLFALRLVPASMEGWIEGLHLSDFLLSLLLPTTFWYIYALAAYFLVSLAVANCGPRVKVFIGLAALALSSISPLYSDLSRDVLSHPWSSPQIPAILANFVWFYVGAFGREPWTKLTVHGSKWTALATSGCYVAVYLGLRLVGLDQMLKPVLSALGLFAVAMACNSLTGTGVVQSLFSRIGRATLPVYIFHIVLISVILEVIARSPIADFYRENPGWLSLLTVPLITVALVVLSFRAGAWVRKSRISFLLDPPVWVFGRDQKHPVSLARPTR